jgi:hypothetical protein
VVDIRRIISRRIRSGGTGVNAVGDVHAVIAANVDEPRSRSQVSSRSRTRVVQRSGRTEVLDSRMETSQEGGDEHARGEGSAR